MKKLNEEHKRKISEGVKKQWAEGRGNPSGILSKEARAKSRLKRLGHKDTPEGKNDWVRLHFGKANKCEEPTCIYPRKDWDGRLMEKPKRYEWANISGKYKRERSDWETLCPSCHRTRDIRNNKL